eukprot:7618486-Lingulodinium_polyedra.AAC.1
MVAAALAAAGRSAAGGAGPNARGRHGPPRRTAGRGAPEPARRWQPVPPTAAAEGRNRLPRWPAGSPFQARWSLEQRTAMAQRARTEHSDRLP